MKLQSMMQVVIPAECLVYFGHAIVTRRKITFTVGSAQLVHKLFADNESFLIKFQCLMKITHTAKLLIYFTGKSVAH